MRIYHQLLVAIFFFAFSASSPGEDDLMIPYEVDATFRASGCEFVTINEAASTELGFQKIYVATCSGVSRYLMAVECKEKKCHTLH